MGRSSRWSTILSATPEAERKWPIRHTGGRAEAAIRVERLRRAGAHLIGSPTSAPCLLRLVEGRSGGNPSALHATRSLSIAIWVHNGIDDVGTSADILVEVARDSWGGEVVGIYYRPSHSGSWGDNLLSDNAPDSALEVSLYQGPVSSIFASAEPDETKRSDPNWNLIQGGVPLVECPRRDPDDYDATLASETGAGTTPVRWVSTQAILGDWQKHLHPDLGYEECLQLDQTVYVRDRYIEIRYKVWPIDGYSCYHPVMFHESPVLFGYAQNPDSIRLGAEVIYDGINPWEGVNPTDLSIRGDIPAQPAPGVGFYQVYPSEPWIGLFRRDEAAQGHGLIIAAPQRTRHEPYAHHWSFSQAGGGVPPNTGGGEVMRVRHFFDMVHNAEESISWTVYVIPGTIATARRVAYDVLPHRKWEFQLPEVAPYPGASLSVEGWHVEWDTLIQRVENGKLKARSYGANPKLLSLDNLDFTTDSIDHIEMKMLVTAGTAGFIEWVTAEYPTSWHRESFTISPSQLNQWVIRTFPVAAVSPNQTLRQLRLGPTNAATGDNGVQIEYIRLVGSANLPYSAEFDSAGNNEGWMPVTTNLRDAPWQGSPSNVANGVLTVASFGVEEDPYVYEPPGAEPVYIYPTLLGPYPTYIAPPEAGKQRVAKIRVKFPAGPPSSRRSVRLRYTCTNCPKVFDYHSTVPCPEQAPEPPPDVPLLGFVERCESRKDCVCPDEHPGWAFPTECPFPNDPRVDLTIPGQKCLCNPPRWPDSRWGTYRMVTRFDLWECDHPDANPAQPPCSHPAKEWNDLTRLVWHELTAVLPAEGTIDQLMLEFGGFPGPIQIDYIRVEYQ